MVRGRLGGGRLLAQVGLDKRVGGAVGEGAMAAALAFRRLAELGAVIA